MSDTFKKYQKDLNQIHVKLTNLEALAAFLHGKRTGDYTTLIQSALPMVIDLAAKLQKTGQAEHSSFEDLVAVGNLAVTTQVSSWKPYKKDGQSFTTWCYRAVLREMLRENTREGPQLNEYWDEVFTPDNNDERVRFEQFVIAQARAELSQWQNVIIERLFYDGVSMRLLAEEFETSISQIHREKDACLKILREKLG